MSGDDDGDGFPMWVQRRTEAHARASCTGPPQSYRTMTPAQMDHRFESAIRRQHERRMRKTQQENEENGDVLAERLSVKTAQACVDVAVLALEEARSAVKRGSEMGHSLKRQLETSRGLV